MARSLFLEFLRAAAVVVVASTMADLKQHEGRMLLLWSVGRHLISKTALAPHEQVHVPHSCDAVRLVEKRIYIFDATVVVVA